jgi:hypothetical protein
VADSVIKALDFMELIATLSHPTLLSGSSVARFVRMVAVHQQQIQFFEV